MRDNNILNIYYLANLETYDFGKEALSDSEIKRKRNTITTKFLKGKDISEDVIISKNFKDGDIV